MSQVTEIKPLEESATKEIAKFYGVPESLIKLFWCEIKGNLYAKAPFHMHQAARKGYQRITTDVSVLHDGDLNYVKDVTTWKTTATLYPRITYRMVEALGKLDRDERQVLIKYMTEPMSEDGYANVNTVKNPFMHPYLREMSIKRAVSRLCARYSGYGGTTFEELPEATLTGEELATTPQVVDRPPKGTKKVNAEKDESQAKIA